jgi:hypothetical protein
VTPAKKGGNMGITTRSYAAIPKIKSLIHKITEAPRRNVVMAFENELLIRNKTIAISVKYQSPHNPNETIPDGEYYLHTDGTLYPMPEERTIGGIDGSILATIDVEYKDLVDIFKRVSVFTAEPYRYNLDSVYLDIPNKKMVATDGHRLLIDPIPEAFKIDSDKEPILLGRLSDINKTLPLLDDKPIRIYVTDQGTYWAYESGAGRIMFCSAENKGDFPEYMIVVPTTQYQVTFDSLTMIQLLKQETKALKKARIKRVSFNFPGLDETSKQVEFFIHSESPSFVKTGKRKVDINFVETTGSREGYFNIVMPMRENHDTTTFLLQYILDALNSIETDLARIRFVDNMSAFIIEEVK